MRITRVLILFQVVKGVLLNPIVFMTAIGIIGNFIFEKKVPSLVDGILEVLGEFISGFCAIMM